MQTKYISIHTYEKDLKADKAKGLLFPELRGTWLPSFNLQQGRLV